MTSLQNDPFTWLDVQFRWDVNECSSKFVERFGESFDAVEEECEADGVGHEDEHGGDEVRRRQTLLFHPGKQESKPGLVVSEECV